MLKFYDITCKGVTGKIKVFIAKDGRLLETLQKINNEHWKVIKIEEVYEDER